MALSTWSLPRKVALALAIPLLLAGTLGGLRVKADLVEASNSSTSARQVTALRPAVDYLTAAERAMVAAVGTGEDGQASLDDALADIRDAADQLATAKQSAQLTEDQQYQIDTVLDLSQALRAEDAATLSPGTWVAQLRQLQSGVTQLVTLVVNEQIDPEPRLELLSQTLAGRFSLAMQQALVATERSGETGSLELFSELGVEGAAIERLASSLGTNGTELASLRTANAQRFRTIRTGGTDLGGAKAYADYDSIVATLQNGIDAELESAAADARRDALVNAGITLAALVAAVLLALLVSRLLLNPIRRVRQGALSVAHEQLPAAVARIRAGEEPGEITPIDVTTREEIGQLARAVDDMHRQAVVLASREAGLREQVSQMFVTLSRRNTSLINQQLGLIERLEQDEEDPKRLESLFRLDHLAARMRRTADSLLILADAPTANAVVDGLTVGDVLQAATSGVQDYQRVRIRSSSPMRVDGSAAADVVHLLTELVDNALTYSPPESTVTIGSSTTAEGVVVEIADAGLGMPAEQVAKLNESLASGGEVTPETARRMGLFVISRLSQRHGLATSLRTNPDGGITATVKLPLAVLPDAAPRSAKPGAARVEEKPAPAAKERGWKRAERRSAEATPARAERAPAMDLSARIDLALGLPTRPAGDPSGAPAPVTPATASAALAALRPLRGEPHDGSAAPPHQPDGDLDEVAPVSAPDATTAREDSAGRPAEGPVGPVPAATAEEVASSEEVASLGGVESAESADGTESLESTASGADTDADVDPDVDADADVHSDSGDPGAGGLRGRLNGLPVRRKSNERPDTEHRDAESAPEASESVGELEAASPELEAEWESGAATVPGAAATEVDPIEPVATTAPQQAVAANDSLGGDWTDPGDESFDTPIFRSLRSAWLSSGDDAQPWRTSEIEAGWEKADEVAESTSAPEVSQSGLPVRRPGTRLVPGGVTATAKPTVRDPEAIRARLAAHASGVSRGRAAATAAPEPS